LYHYNYFFKTRRTGRSVVCQGFENLSLCRRPRRRVAYAWLGQPSAQCRVGSATALVGIDGELPPAVLDKVRGSAADAAGRAAQILNG
jgi:hypothetical protein